MPMNTYSVNPGKRLLVMLVDYVLMSILAAIIIGPFIKLPAKLVINSTQSSFLQLFDKESVYLILLGMTIFLCKDCIGGRSVAKRIFKYQVLDSKTGAPATPLQCLLRNFSVVFWPVEVLMVFFNPVKRLGDRISGTIVAPYEDRQSSSPIRWVQIPICLLLGFAFLYLFLLP